MTSLEVGVVVGILLWALLNAWLIVHLSTRPARRRQSWLRDAHLRRGDWS